jgi:hypothetical protein
MDVGVSGEVPDIQIKLKDLLDPLQVRHTMATVATRPVGCGAPTMNRLTCSLTCAGAV